MVCQAWELGKVPSGGRQRGADEEEQGGRLTPMMETGEMLKDREGEEPLVAGPLRCGSCAALVSTSFRTVSTLMKFLVMC